jgi:ATP-binding cassette subfamily B protein
MQFFHSRGTRGDQSRESGLTGSPDIPEPPQQRPKGIRGRWQAIQQATSSTLAALPRVIRLVWDATPGLTVGLGLATVLMGVVPAATAYTTRELINTVVFGFSVHGDPTRLTSLQVPLPFHVLNTPSMPLMTTIVVLAVVQFLIFALQSLLSAVRNITQQLMQEKMTLQIQQMVMEQSATLDLEFFEDSASYDLLRRAQQDAASRPVQMISSVFGLIQTAITFASMLALLLFISPLLAGIALLSPVPAFIADTRYGWWGYNIARWASPLRRRMQYLTTLVTTDTYAKEVKLFGLGGYFTERFKLLANTYYERQRRLVRSRYLVGFALSSITTLVGSGTYLYIAVRAIQGLLTVGDLTMYTSAVSSVQSSIQGLLSGFSGMYENNLYLNNLYDLLATKSRIKAPAEPRPLPRPLRGEIEFQNVSFNYPGSGAEALTGLTFTIAAGETLAVVGRNGAGKTTLIKLLCRLYDPSEGRILLDGIDIREFDPDELRAAIGAMFQDYVTYQATASENIGLGEVGEIENRPAIEAAARRGGVDDLVARLPDGYDTPLGRWFEGGVNLSGGEWQKVALGRAFMRDAHRARILVLDEPTSALDAQAEYELFERLRQLSEGRTAIYISHRFSTVRQADRILFLERGRLVEEGTHDELMALRGRYARLFTMQASAYTGETIDIAEIAG